MALCEENRDEEDLINLVNPPKQMNHRSKPAHALKSKLKNSKLHLAQKRQEQFAANQMAAGYNMHGAKQPQGPMPVRANSANAKSKFLTKTQTQ